MAGSVRLEFISEGFHEILCSPEVGSLVGSAARTIASNAAAGGGEYETTQKVGYYGGGRQIAYVATADYAAMRAQATSKSLEKAVHA